MLSLVSTAVFFPRDHYELTTALQRYSIALDAFFGPEHPLCAYYRNWIRDGWSAIDLAVRQFVNATDADYPATAYARFATWIALRMSLYLQTLERTGISAELPKLRTV
jgi:hypothetical protein